MNTIIVKQPMKKEALQKLAKEGFGDVVKAVVDVKQGIMAIGGELHADEETLLTENEHSDRKDTWGVNLYPGKSGEDFIEFDSMINLKPALGNRSRGVDDANIREAIKKVVETLIVE